MTRCVDNQLYILNGHTLGDLTGQYTCHMPRGSSIVDYFIASRSLSNCVHSINVHDINLFSDHCMMNTKLKIGSNLCYDENASEDLTNVRQLDTDNFVWNECHKLKFKEAFSSSVIKNKLDELKKSLENNSHDVDEQISNIADVIVSAGEMKSDGKAINRNWSNQKPNPALKTKMGNK